MENVSIIEKALLNNTRVQTSKGALTIGQLFDLPLEAANGELNLNNLAQSINVVLQNSKDFINPDVQTEAAKKAEVDLAIVVRVIKLKSDDRKNKEDTSYQVSERKKLEAILAKRKESEYDTLSNEELQNRIAALKESN